TPPNELRQPGLAVWHSGKEDKQIQAALAWGDGKLRVWDLEPAGGKLWEAADGSFNTSVAYLPGQDRILTGSRLPAQPGREGLGQVTAWSLDGKEGPKRIAAEMETFPNSGTLQYFPWLIAPFASQMDDKLDRAAVVLREIEIDAAGKAKSESYVLQ